jgi:hypothetical protein
MAMLFQKLAWLMPANTNDEAAIHSPSTATIPLSHFMPRVVIRPVTVSAGVSLIISHQL